MNESLRCRGFSRLQPRHCRTFRATACSTTIHSSFGMSEHGGTTANLLDHKDDNYEGVVVTSESLPSDGATFRSGLNASVQV